MEFGSSSARKLSAKMADNARTADICPRIYRDKTALGQRVWPRQIDSASSLLRVTLRYCEHYGRVPCHGFSFIFPPPSPIFDK